MAAAVGEPLAKTSRHKHWLLRLPTAFWSRMYLYLDYSDILNLALLSPDFRDAHIERYIPWIVRHQVVAYYDKKAATIRSGQQRSACYLCFRMRSINSFQPSPDMITYARVKWRNPETGQRTFEPMGLPAYGQLPPIAPSPPIPSLPSLPPTPVSPVGQSVPYSTGRRLQVHGLDVSSLSSQAVPRSPFNVPPDSSRRQLGAPGADVNQVETLRRYCIDCALETGLLREGDRITTQGGSSYWVCYCRTLHVLVDNERCPVCFMGPVYGK